jgi:hypothetical protein
LGFTVGRWGSTGVRGITDPKLGRRHGSEVTVERLAQEGLLQLCQGGESAFVEVSEALVFVNCEIQACLVSA